MASVDFPAWRVALVIYGILNAILYASLLPLWEGFDEPFHYGYVQELSQNRRLPELGKTGLSKEVCKSLDLAPASHVVKRNLPGVTTFSEYFEMPDTGRNRIRAELNNLVVTKEAGTCGLNYEAHQAPLAYALLATADRLWMQSNLPVRILRLRLLCAILSSVGTAGLLFLLAGRLRLPDHVTDAVVFIVFSSQMFYATTAHIANDWLAVPLMVLLFERLIAAWENPTGRNVAFMAATLGAGLLTKAYFLALIPVAAGVMLVGLARQRLRWRSLAQFWTILVATSGFWYVRNIQLYRNVSGMQETNGGTDLGELVTAFLAVPWIRSLTELLYNSLWTGNNSLGTFSRKTLTMLLAGYCLAALFYAIRSKHKLRDSEQIILWGSIAYIMALIYSTTLNFWASGGIAFTASPWYTQPIIPLVTILLSCGVARQSRGGKAITIWLIALSAYVLCATYWAKLIPLYGGYREVRATIPKLLSWYTFDFSGNMGLMSVTLLGSPELVLTLAAVVAVAAIALAIALSIRQHRCGKTA